MLRKFIICLILPTILIAGMASAHVKKIPVPRDLPVMGAGNTDAPSSSAVPGGRYAPSALDSQGIGYIAGTTYYDSQHNGSSGKMVSVDAAGLVHMVWMNGLNPSSSTRHVFYNYWDPSTETFGMDGGTQIDVSTRAGYICLTTTPEGFCFPGFHQQQSGETVPHGASAIDYLPANGAFTSFSIQPYIYEDNVALQCLWPKISVGRDGKLHLVTNEGGGVAGSPQRVWYSRGTPVFDQGTGSEIQWDLVDAVNNSPFLEIDTAKVIAADIAASRHSDRVVMVWNKPRRLGSQPWDSVSQWNNDVVMQVSEDGGNNWAPEVNITNFEWPDWDCVSQDTLVCDRDTLRAYTDANVIFDINDNIHIAFTTRYLFELEGLGFYSFSDIWHWGEEFQEFTPICHGRQDSGSWVDPGAWQLVVHRPNLAIDTTNGYLYCSYQWYDSMNVGASGWPQGDAFVSVSCDNGRVWSKGVNVTTAHHEENQAAGSCENIRDITIARDISYSNGTGYISMEYIFDRDAGASIASPTPEGVATLNACVLRRIPVDSILTEMHTLNNPFWPILRYDSTGFPGRVVPLDTSFLCADAADHQPTLRPESFKLYQNYPNPFNPTTNIQFDLSRDARVTLKIFNVLGQEVATLYNNQVLTAGAKTVHFDAANLASGVYVYQINVGDVKASRKMVVMK